MLREEEHGVQEHATAALVPEPEDRLLEAFADGWHRGGVGRVETDGACESGEEGARPGEAAALIPISRLR